MSAIASQITGVSSVCSNVCSGADQRKHQSSASLAFVKGIHRWPVDSPRKEPVMQTMFPFDDGIMAMPWCGHVTAITSLNRCWPSSMTSLCPNGCPKVNEIYKIWGEMSCCLHGSRFLGAKCYPGARPTNDISIEIQWNCVMLLLVIYSVDQNEILHMSRQ